MTTKSFPLNFVVTRDEVLEQGLEVEIDATSDERDALAAYLDIPAVEAMSAHLTVSRWRGRGLAVRGTVEARVVQTCVVTLDPVENAIHENVEAFYAPDIAPRPEEDTAEGAEIADLDVEPLINDRIDVGALVCEHLALGLDPYPRKPGAAFSSGAEDAGEERKSGAFAALAALRGDENKQ
jgi:uncharacterized protein